VSEPTPRQVLYALVAAGFVGVTLVLIVGAAAAGLTPVWWSICSGAALLAVTAYLLLRWRRTATALGLAIGLLVVWVVGTLVIIPIG